MIVVDASIIATALADDGADGAKARQRLLGEQLAAPSLLDLEAVSAWRRLEGAGDLDARRVELAIADLQDLRLERVPPSPLLARCWDLRANLTVYDAAYVALAEALGVPFVTADRRLARAPGPRCLIEVIE